MAVRKHLRSIIKVHLFIAIFFLTVLSLLSAVFFFPSGIIARMIDIFENDAANLILLFSISPLLSVIVTEPVFKVYQKIREKRSNTLKLGEILVLGGFINETQLDDALSEQGHRMGEILIQAGRIKMNQLQHALDLQKENQIKIGKILRRMGYSTQKDINWALNQAKRRIGQILVEKRVISFHQLQHALAIQQEFHPVGI